MFINYAHRGASEYYPENTFSAFYAGLEMGANGIETDIHRTKDGVLVLFHDDEIDRVTDGTGMISDYTYGELMRLRVFDRSRSQFDRIVTLEDFLKYFSFRDLTFAIELKQDGVEKETIDMLEAFGVRKKTILTSFSYESIRIAKQYDPRYRVGYLYDEEEKEPLEKLREIGGEELCPLAELLDREMVEEYHKLGLSVRAWGIYTPAIMERACACGVDGMTINFPDVLTRFLREHPCKGEEDAR